jgi:phage tail sheath protein FI
MANVRKFRFVSPGVFLDEIDNSRLPRETAPVGPVLIGRTDRGPGMRPVKVNSQLEYSMLFGDVITGGNSDDVWRNGNKTSPMYSTLAAKAWLANSAGLSIVRLLGVQHPQATTGGAAGWDTTNTPNATQANHGGAMGLFIIPSASAQMTGTLAAVWYCNEGSVRLQGTDALGGTIPTAKGLLHLAKSTNRDEFKVVVEDGTTSVITASFNFQGAGDEKYIRNVFNTNPTSLDSDALAATDRKKYWLGQTFDRAVEDAFVAAGSPASSYAFITTIENGHSFRTGYKTPKTGWIISQDMSTATGSYSPSSMNQLFQLHALDGGEEIQRKVKISITDIKPSTNTSDKYGTFTVLVRNMTDHDGKQRVLESYTNCNLNPKSANFVSKKIGDKYMEWDTSERRFKEYGSHANISQYVRVKVADAVERATADEKLLPFGFLGHTHISGSRITNLGITGSLFDGVVPTAFTTGSHFGTGDTGSAGVNITLSTNYATNAGAKTSWTSLKLGSPSMALRLSSSEGNISDPKTAFFGFDSTEKNTTNFDKSNLDILRMLPTSYDTHTAVANKTQLSVQFSLDDVKFASSSAGVESHGVYLAGARKAGSSLTAGGPGAVSSSYNAVLDAGFDSFTLPLAGGFDGVNIKKKDPFSNTGLASGTDKTNYAKHTMTRAIDAVEDPEVVEMNALSAPGITNTAVTDRIIQVCEERADALAVIDLENGYVAPHESSAAESARLGGVSTTISALKARGINSSYACTFYPWVQTNEGGGIWVPPSVAAIGTFSSVDANDAPWFAPAGFTRGGLTEGAAGISVTGVRETLTKRNRDKLYERNVNPIAKFPAEGIVMFGQKTLQVTPSALDRINVRRLMIHVKKGISNIAARLLFDPNTKVTWERFTNQAVPFLDDIKQRFGLEDFRVVLDETTTTPDLVDRNILYAKVMLKPTRAVEFIAIDFVIQRSGASFDD